MLTLPPILDQSYCYISDNPTHRQILHDWGLQYDLPAWVPQRDVSRALFGQGGIRTVMACEQHYGPFVWGTQFANVHATFHYQPNAIVIDGETFAGSEQYYQAMKSFGQPDHDMAKAAIRIADPMTAWHLGQHYSIRPDWRSVSAAVMTKAVTAKFTQDKGLQQLLLSTGEHPLVQLKPSDAYWGTGRENNGRNKLGAILQQLRTAIRQGQYPTL